MDKPPKKGKCPQCGNMGNRCWTAPALHFVGMDFYTNQARVEKYNKYGMDKDTANNFLNKSIKGSKENMKQGRQHYKEMCLDTDYAAEKGLLKRVDDKTKIERSEITKKNNEALVKKAYKK